MSRGDEARYEVALDRRAEKELLDAPVDIQDRFFVAFGEIAVDPFRARPGCDVKRLAGRPLDWRLRVGSWRALYRVEGNRVRFTTFQSGHRAYR